MNFFEQELRKIVRPIDPDAVYVGSACYLRLGEMNRAKLQIAAGTVADEFDRLRIKILNRQEGEIDILLLRFSDLFGQRSRKPYIWTYDGKTEWYGGRPNECDYRALTDAVHRYVDLFRDPVHEQTEADGQRWEQSM